MTYFRVIPRDLFNKGKLLTELGFLSLAIHDNKDGIANVLSMELTQEEDGFLVEQDPDDGSISVSNLTCWTKSLELVHLYITINCRDTNALRFSYRSKDLDIEGAVFEDENYSSSFKILLSFLEERH